MKAVILAGGRGTRISEESVVRPKPMITIGSQPILWHIMNIYAAHGVTDFVICLGYKGYMIKEYFSNFMLHAAEAVEFDLAAGNTTYGRIDAPKWRVTLVETGEDTQTGGRIKRIAPWVKDEKAFCLTYGDGLADVDIAALIDRHHKQGKLATVTAVSPPGRFGAMQIKNGTDVSSFTEKPSSGQQFINGGFFVLSPRVLDFIEGDDTIWEREPLQALAKQGQLTAFPHAGFWQPMDTIREREILEQLWSTGKAPWTRGSSA
jgi:glucose-1-phosphate cytidylyltransferase